MMSLLMRFALLSSIIYCAVPDARVISASDIASAGSRLAHQTAGPVGHLHVSREMQGFGKLIGFNPHGLEKLEAQLAHTALPTPAERTRVIKRFTKLVSDARHIVAAADHTSNVVAANLHDLMQDRAALARARESLRLMSVAAESLGKGARDMGAN